MKTSTFRTIAIALTFIVLLVSVFALFNKSWMIGGAGLLATVFLLYFAFNTKLEPEKIPLHEIIENVYKPTMENHFHISIPKDIKIFFNEERLGNYVVVLHGHEKETAEDYYYPFEADMFTGQLGRGVGQFFTSETEAQFWMNKHDKSQSVAEQLGRSISDNVAKKIREELEFKKMTGGDDDGERENRTPGG